MSCSPVAAVIVFLMGSQICSASLLAKKRHHHKHREHAEEAQSTPKLDKLLADHEEEQQATNDHDPQDPNDWMPMDRETLDAEFPVSDQDGVHHTGIYDFRAGHFAILDTPQKMDPEWQAEQHLKAVNALSGRRSGVFDEPADDDDDDE